MATGSTVIFLPRWMSITPKVLACDSDFTETAWHGIEHDYD